MSSFIRTLALTPILLPQALWVASRAVRLPEAAGPRAGQSGAGAPLSLLIVGDSSAAGVGVVDQRDALAGGLVRRFAKEWDVSWSLVATSGWTSAQVRTALASLPPAQVDVVVLAVGVNDVKNGVGLRTWRHNYSAILETLRDRHGAAHVVASGVPPLGVFPLLPAPLRSVLGARASRFDAELAAICARAPGVIHLPFDQPMDPAGMASDGFHPGAPIYDAWASAVFEAVALSRPNPR